MLEIGVEAEAEIRLAFEVGVEWDNHKLSSE